MPQDSMTSKPGTAPIVKVGQTANGNFGDDPNLKAKGRAEAHDLTAK